jgi:hypothetical protein
VSTERIKAKRQRLFVEVDGKRIGSPSCGCGQCMNGKPHPFGSWKAAMEFLSRCPYLVGRNMRIAPTNVLRKKNP